MMESRTKLQNLGLKLCRLPVACRAGVICIKGGLPGLLFTIDHTKQNIFIYFLSGALGHISHYVYACSHLLRSCSISSCSLICRRNWSPKKLSECLWSAEEIDHLKSFRTPLVCRRNWTPKELSEHLWSADWRNWLPKKLSECLLRRLGCLQNSNTNFNFISIPVAPKVLRYCIGWPVKQALGSEWLNFRKLWFGCAQNWKRDFGLTTLGLALLGVPTLTERLLCRLCIGH